MPRLYRVNGSVLGGILAVPLIAAWVSPGFVARQVAGMFPPGRQPPGYAGYVGAALTIRRHSLRANAVQRVTLRSEIEAMVPAYAGLDLPFELVHGDADDTVDFGVHALAMARDAPGAHLTRLPGLGHMPHHLAADTIVAAVDRAAARSGLDVNR